MKKLSAAGERAANKIARAIATALMRHFNWVMDPDKILPPKRRREKRKRG